MNPRRSRLVEVDEDGAALAMPEIRRWQSSDFDDWLLTRLNHRWAASEVTWRGKMASFAAGNDFLFITNEAACLLAMRQPHVMTGKPIVHEIFAWARDADIRDNVYETEVKRDGFVALRLLYRYMAAWAKGMGSPYGYIGVSSDIPPSKLQDMFARAHYLVRIRI